MIKVLVKVDDILDEIGKSDGISFSDIMKKTGINKSTIAQLLTSMSALGWISRDISRDGKKEYFLGEKLLGHAKKTLGSESLRYALGEAVRRLALATGETASASILIGEQRVRVAKAYGKNEIMVDEENAASGHGGILATATGRLLTAFQTTVKRSQIIKANGKEETPELLGELDEIKKTGFARHKSAGGLVDSMARGVFSRNGRIAAAIGVAVSTYHLSKETEKIYIEKVYEAAKFVEKLLKL